MKNAFKRVAVCALCLIFAIIFSALPVSAQTLDSVGEMSGSAYLTLTCALVVVLVAVFLLALAFLGIVIIKIKKK